MVGPDEPDEGIGLISAEEKSSPKAAATAGPAAVSAPAPAVPAFVAPKIEAPTSLSLKAADETDRQVTADTITTLSVVLESSAADAVTSELQVEVAYTSTYPGEGAEWPVRWLLPGKKNFVELVRKVEKAKIPLQPRVPVSLSFEVQAPVGIRYGDRVELRVAATSDQSGRPTRITLSWTARQSVLAIKSSRGYEREVADTLLTRAEEKPDVLFALLVPSGLRGYVFAEGMSLEGVREMLKGIRKARGLVEGETTLKEVEPLLVPKITVEGFVEGAIVELVAGPFKGEKARVKKIDQAKEEITVELIEAVVPIPVTVRGDHVRMLERGGGKSGG
jgi:transcription termination/antitermination protein NusG